jgi:hypothetical protein
VELLEPIARIDRSAAAMDWNRHRTRSTERIECPVRFFADANVAGSKHQNP